MGGSITKKRQLCEIMSSLGSAALLQVVFLEKGDLNFFSSGTMNYAYNDTKPRPVD